MAHQVLLCILDGWGYTEKLKNNAIALANTPNFDSLFRKNHAFLKTSGADVGLPEDQFGNSEVGHMTIGAGRIIKNDLVRINDAIFDNSFVHNERFDNFVQKCRISNNRCHLIGLLSDGGVHSHINHILYVVNQLYDLGIEVILHAITDGRDVPPQSAIKYFSMLDNSKIKIGSIAGRYYAMDRDLRFERTKLYYEALMGRADVVKDDVDHFIDSCYKENIFDEFFVPSVFCEDLCIKNFDSVFFMNFRADRMRQIAEIISDQKNALDLNILSMTQYSDLLNKRIASIFSKENIENTLGDVIAKNQKRQLRIAETEKYAHVTYFFNGGKEDVCEREDRVLIPSPKVATYDLMPEMSAYKITDYLISAIQSESYDFICVNFANADMVGHTGNLESTIKACQVIDECIGKILQLSKLHNIEIFITADHGNAEELFDDIAGQRHTSHTNNLVPILYNGKRNVTLLNGSLEDVAPTILQALGLERPSEMTGKCLFLMKS